MSKEAMKLALDALRKARRKVLTTEECHAVIMSIKEALAEQKSGIKQVIELYDSPDQPSQQEPVAWMRQDGQRVTTASDRHNYPDYETRYSIPLYTTPPQRTWVGLTDEERIMCRSYDPEEAVAKTEAKLKEKNK